MLSDAQTPSASFLALEEPYTCYNSSIMEMNNQNLARKFTYLIKHANVYEQHSADHTQFLLLPSLFYRMY